MTDGNAQLFVATRNGMAIRIEEEKTRALSRSAHGVRAIKLREGDHVVSMARVRQGATLLTVTEKGYGKRTELDAYRIQNRGGFGLLNYKTSDEKGYVCGIKIVDETDDIILISNDGIIIRIRCEDIRTMGRYATGVRVMKVQDESRVVSFTRAEHDDEAELATVDQPSEEELEEDMKNAQAEELENTQAENEAEATDIDEETN
jgi:DNA gyrase subunit A